MPSTLTVNCQKETILKTDFFFGEFNNDVALPESE